jgi:Mg-chelatase subunit ChlD
MSALSISRSATPVLTIRSAMCIVLFNLDMSGSMDGSRWTRVKNSVSSFLRYMAPSDLVGAVCFNESPRII